jgi:hypothetical protein
MGVVVDYRTCFLRLFTFWRTRTADSRVQLAHIIYQSTCFRSSICICGFHKHPFESHPQTGNFGAGKGISSSNVISYVLAKVRWISTSWQGTRLGEKNIQGLESYALWRPKLSVRHY